MHHQADTNPDQYSDENLMLDESNGLYEMININASFKS